MTFSKQHLVLIGSLCVLGIIAASAWLEKHELRVWQERLFLPNFIEEPNRHTPLEPIGTYLAPRLSGNQTFTPEGNPLLIAGNVTIPAGATVRFTPGTRILVHEYGSLAVEGSLIAQGTRNQPIVFSTNEAHISNRSWAGIIVSAGGQVSLDYVSVKYASPAITCEATGTATIRNSTLERGNVGLFTRSARCHLISSIIQYVTDGIVAVGVTPQLTATSINAADETIRLFD